MLKCSCFALVCENTCLREIKAPEKKKKKAAQLLKDNEIFLVEIQAMYPGQLMEVCILPSQIPAPGSEQDSFSSSPCPSQAGRDVQCLAADRTRTSLLPLLPATCPTERQTEQFYSGTGQPLSAHTFWRLTIQRFLWYKCCPIQYLVDQPKAAGLHSSPLSKRGAELLLPQFWHQNAPLYPGFYSQQKYCVKAQREQVTDVSVPCSDRPSCPHSNPKLQELWRPLGPQLQGQGISYSDSCPCTKLFYLVLSTWGKLLAIFSLNPTSDDFCLGLDLQMKYNALGSLGLGMALLACSLG